MVNMSVTTNVIIYMVIYVISRRVVGWIVGTDSHGFCSTKGSGNRNFKIQSILNYS